MGRQGSRAEAQREVALETVRNTCPECGKTLMSWQWLARTVVTLDGLLKLNVHVRRCIAAGCARKNKHYRPEMEGRWVLPSAEFGLDVIAEVGRLRYRENRSATEIHHALRQRGMQIAPRSVPNLIDRYDELVALAVTEPAEIARKIGESKRVILAIDGLQPTVGHEVLWVIRECLSQQILLAKSLLSARTKDLATLLDAVKSALPEDVAIVGIVSDGQRSIRKAVQSALPGVPHQLCHFHYLREAGKGFFEADRAAKKELKKRLRGVRSIEREMDSPNVDDEWADIVRGYCTAVRAALTAPANEPLSAGGLAMKAQLEAITQSLERVLETKKGSQRSVG